MTPEEIYDRLQNAITLLASIRRRDIFPFSPLNGALSFLSLRNHLVDPRSLRSLLERSLPYRDLQEARVITQRRHPLAHLGTFSLALLEQGINTNSTASPQIVPFLY